MAPQEPVENSIVDIKKFLQDGTDVDMAEFNEFWKSLTDEEKADFRSTPLPPPKQP